MTINMANSLFGRPDITNLINTVNGSEKPNSNARKAVRPLVSQMIQTNDDVRTTIESLYSQVAKLKEDARFDPAYKLSESAHLVSAFEDYASSMLGRMNNLYQTCIKLAYDAALPQRPATDNLAAQEAQLQNLRLDLRMVADSKSGMEFVEFFRLRLIKAMESGDDLLAWLITSDWSVDYAESRGVPEQIMRSAIDDALKSVLATGETATAREILKVLQTEGANFVAQLDGAVRHTLQDVAFGGRSSY